MFIVRFNAFVMCAISEVHYTFTDFRLPINQANNPTGLMSGLVLFLLLFRKIGWFYGGCKNEFFLVSYVVCMSIWCLFSLCNRQLKKLQFLETYNVYKKCLSIL